MRPLKSRATYATIALVAAALACWWAYSVFAMPDVRPPTGDGSFRDISWRFPWVTIGLPVPGYTVTFDRFDLSTDHEMSYEVGNLAPINSNVGVYLCVPDPSHELQSDESHQELSAALQLEVTDEKGNVVVKLNRSLKDLIWSFPEGGANTHGLYDLDESFFFPAPNTRYRIRSKYKGDPKFNDREGFLLIRCGGHI